MYIEVFWGVKHGYILRPFNRHIRSWIFQVKVNVRMYDVGYLYGKIALEVRYDLSNIKMFQGNNLFYP